MLEIIVVIFSTKMKKKNYVIVNFCHCGQAIWNKQLIRRIYFGPQSRRSWFSMKRRPWLNRTVHFTVCRKYRQEIKWRSDLWPRACAPSHLPPKTMPCLLFTSTTQLRRHIQKTSNDSFIDCLGVLRNQTLPKSYQPTPICEAMVTLFTFKPKQEECLINYVHPGSTTVHESESRVCQHLLII